MTGIFGTLLVLLLVLAVMLGYVMTVVGCALLEIDERRGE